MRERESIVSLGTRRMWYIRGYLIENAKKLNLTLVFDTRFNMTSSVPPEQPCVRDTRGKMQ